MYFSSMRLLTGVLLLIKLADLTGAAQALDDTKKSLAPKAPPYSYTSLMGVGGVPTELFIKLKDQTDTLVKQTRLAPEYYADPQVKIHNNGNCLMPREAFVARQALAIASNVHNQEEYATIYFRFHRLYQDMLSELPDLEASASLEDVFMQRRARDQYWRGRAWEKVATEGELFSSPAMEYVFYNYVTYEMCSIDKDNKFFLKKFVEENGWPSIEEYGPKVSSAAWLITQHADHDLRFQKRMLSLLKERLSAAFADKRGYAYLYDRVAVNSSKPQRYGTQIHCENGTVQPRQLENELLLNEFRESMDLGPIEDYLKLFTHCESEEKG